MRHSDFLDKFVIRLPDGIRHEIKELAKVNRRSMNAEIVLAIEDHIKRLEKARAKRADKASA